jgi:Asp-tRNA(Asn)/Glu-tRNA(Gln) amidotransferase B subunit
MASSSAGVMRQSGGNASPALVSQLVQERLGG